MCAKDSHRSHTLIHRDKIAKEHILMVSFLLHKLKYHWPRVMWGFRVKSFPYVALLISTSRIQLVLHPHPPEVPLLSYHSLRVAVINWWQSRSPRSSSGPGSLMPVFWSTHQHFPRCPSRAGWHCGHETQVMYQSHCHSIELYQGHGEFSFFDWQFPSKV